jgi:hypothetical protein
MLGASLDLLVTSFTTHSMGTLPHLQGKDDSVLPCQANPLLILPLAPYFTKPYRFSPIMKLVPRTTLTLFLVHLPTFLLCLTCHLDLKTFNSLPTFTYFHHPFNPHHLLPTPPTPTKHSHTPSLLLSLRRPFLQTGPLTLINLMTLTPCILVFPHHPFHLSPVFLIFLFSQPFPHFHRPPLSRFRYVLENVKIYVDAIVVGSFTNVSLPLQFPHLVTSFIRTSNVHTTL